MCLCVTLQMPAAQQGGDEEMAEAGEEELPSQEDREDAAVVAAGAADLSPSNPRMRTEGKLAFAQMSMQNLGAAIQTSWTGHVWRKDTQSFQLHQLGCDV